MIALIAVSIIWAFSFGLIKGELTGLNATVVASIRLLLCFLVFLPFALKGKLYRPQLKLMTLGAVQFGVMYIAYIWSYQYLPGYLVALFTIFTPFYVMLFSAFLLGKFRPVLLLPVMLSIAGAAVIVFKNVNSAQFIHGFLILQIANIAFAFGQVQYKKVAKSLTTNHVENMVSMYFGAALLTALAAMPHVLTHEMLFTSRQIAVLLYLGVVASGLGFYLWNLGAQQVNPATLAILNNGYVPLALLFSLTIFDENGDYGRLAVGSAFIIVSVFWANNMTRNDEKLD